MSRLIFASRQCVKIGSALGIIAMPCLAHFTMPLSVERARYRRGAGHWACRNVIFRLGHDIVRADDYECLSEAPWPARRTPLAT